MFILLPYTVMHFLFIIYHLHMKYYILEAPSSCLLPAGFSLPSPSHLWLPLAGPPSFHGRLLLALYKYSETHLNVCECFTFILFVICYNSFVFFVVILKDFIIWIQNIRQNKNSTALPVVSLKGRFLLPFSRAYKNTTDFILYIIWFTPLLWLISIF